ncbi:chemotaxis protein CheA [Natronorubrum sp. JWXQ-INN-674]|uniref:Chemotaxis protein CheA n=1 Tax=Natronorubrum halalkaliphilum TaxID=2691917 RepID=A0A6B0VST0_9EURY|nr:chemotaxis protein CheC [Natronorubrum halalkaliphilum]MXV63569.1 chemotaxis protein CheA [Natronorubrum halalkaliphilum]
MEIDIRSLETYNELAREGTESAATALRELTGVETRVDVTDVSLLSVSDLQYEFAGRTFAGVEVSLGAPLSGETVLAFDEAGRDAITSELVPTDDPERVEEAIAEAGNIMVNGFISGWADHLDTKVEVSPPTYVEGTGIDVLPEAMLAGKSQSERKGERGSPDATTSERDDVDGESESNGEYVFVFRSRVEAIGEDIDFRMLLFPKIESIEQLLESDGDGNPDTDATGGNDGGNGISLDKLEVFTEMTERGATKAAANVTTMTGLETAVEVNQLSFIPIADIPAQVGDDRRVGTAVEYTGSPSGYLAILFDPASARESVDALLPVESDGEWGERDREALEELCNIVASGFLDGWANVLETSIKHSPPRFIADMGSSIMSPIIADIGRTENYAFLLDSTIKTGDSDSLQCQLFALPRRDELATALEELLVNRAGKTRADPDELFE